MTIVLDHEHSLTLIDLNPKYPYDDVVYDDEEDLIAKQAFRRPCKLCSHEITFLHRYYYKCDICDYSIHKLCEELPKRQKHASHSHSSETLTTILDEPEERCHICKRIPRYKQLLFRCFVCMLNICLDCDTDKIQNHAIYHPSHQHPLVPIDTKILASCDACGKKQEDVFYNCATCFRYFIHKDCVFKPKRLLTQENTCSHFFHHHPLILTYSFPKEEQEAKYDPPCRVCGNSFCNNEKLWVYKCEKCRYYVHLHCANLTSKPFDSGTPSSRNYEDDASYFHLPLPNQTYNIIQDFFFKETKDTTITHNSHSHPLTLVETQCNDITKLASSTIAQTSSFLELRNHRDKDLCYMCKRPVVNTFSFYKCPNKECRFVLHEWCARLPNVLKTSIGEQQHHHGTLLLRTKSPYQSFDNHCRVCFDYCNEFCYYCDKCHSSLHVGCAFVPRILTHKSHQNHLLFRNLKRSGPKDQCRLCLSRFTSDDEISLSCNMCGLHLHPSCALLFPEKVCHKYDKHLLTLTYSPVEDHEGDYFCEVCEDELNPNDAFYHCQDCAQSIHLACAPITPEYKAYVYEIMRYI